VRRELAAARLAGWLAGWFVFWWRQLAALGQSINQPTGAAVVIVIVDEQRRSHLPTNCCLIQLARRCAVQSK